MLFIMTPRERRERRESLPEWLRKHEKIKFKTTLEVARFVFDVCGISEYVPDDIDNFPGAPDINLSVADEDIYTISPQALGIITQVILGHIERLKLVGNMSRPIHKTDFSKLEKVETISPEERLVRAAEYLQANGLYATYMDGILPDKRHFEGYSFCKDFTGNASGSREIGFVFFADKKLVGVDYGSEDRLESNREFEN